jgi:hypothetical protein
MVKGAPVILLARERPVDLFRFSIQTWKSALLNVNLGISSHCITSGRHCSARPTGGEEGCGDQAAGRRDQGTAISACSRRRD